MRWNLNWHKLCPIFYIFCGCLLLAVIFNRPASEYFCQKGTDYYWSDEWSKSELCFHIALAINPWFAEAHSGLGDLFAMGDVSSVVSQGSLGAEKEYRQAIRLKPDYARAHFGLGWVLDLHYKYEEAEKEMREAIRLSPNTYRYHEVLGEFLEYHKRYAEAEKEYLELLRLKPDNPETLKSLALLLYNQGRRKEARVYWEKLLTAEKDPVWVQRIKQRLAEPD